MAKDTQEKIKKITPSPEELIMTPWQEKLPVKCSEPGCNHVAANLSVMNLHKAKVHKITSSPGDDVLRQYHCPVNSCYFNEESERYFKSLDILRVHYMKVHSAKNFKCAKCDKGFGLARDCQRHEEECGQSFSCPQCGKVYTKKDSLLKHCDVQKHTKPNFPSKPKPVKKVRATKPKETDLKPERKKEKPVFILPKQSSHILVPVESQSVNLQTDMTGAQFIISKPSQAVQTSHQPESGVVKTVSIQTTQGVQKQLSTSVQCPSEKISLGIQTIVLMPPLPPLQSCVAETQTAECAVKSSKGTKTAPVVKISKGTQKSPFTKLRKRKGVMKSSSSSQTNPFSEQQKSDLPVSSSQLERSVSLETTGLWNTNLSTPPHTVGDGQEPGYRPTELASSMEEILTSMSTQTDLSCLLNQLLPLPQSHDLTRILDSQNSHTQTSLNEYSQFDSDYLQNSETQILQHENFTPSLFKQKDESITMQAGSQTCQQAFQDQATWTTAENVLSCHTQTPLGKKYIQPHHFDSKFSKETQYCSSKMNFHQNQNIQTETAQVLGLEYQEQTTQTQASFQSIHSQTSHLDNYIFTGLECQESTNNNFSSNVNKTPFFSFEFQEDDTETSQLFNLNSIPGQDSATQTWHRNTQTKSVAVDESPVPSSSYTPVSLNSTLSQTSAAPTDQSDNMLNKSLDILLDMDHAESASTEQLETRSKELLGNIFLETSNDPCKTVSGLNQSHKSESIITVSPRTSFGESFYCAVHRERDQDDTFTKSKRKSANGQYQSDSYDTGTISTTTNEFVGGTSSQTLSNPAWDMGTQTLDDLMWGTATQTIHNFEQEIENQISVASVTSSQIVDNLGLEMGTQSRANMSQEMDNRSDLEIETQTSNSIMASESMDYLNLEMGTQTMADMNWESISQAVEIGTQTKAEIATSQTMGMSWESASQALNDLAFDTESQTVVENMESQTHIDCNLQTITQNLDDMSWKLRTSSLAINAQSLEKETQREADMTNNNLGLESGTQTLGDLASLQTIDNVGLEIQTQAIINSAAQQTMNSLGMEMGTQTIDGITSLSLEMGSQASADMASQQAEDGLGLEMGTQAITGVNFDIAQQTMNGLGLEMGTQTMVGVNWDTAEQVMDGLDLEMGTQTMTGMNLDSAQQTMDDLGLEMGTQTMACGNWDTSELTVDGMSLEMGTQTIAGVNWCTGEQTVDGSGLEMGTQTITDIGWDMAQETMDGSGLEMGTQTITDVGWDMAQETMDGSGLEMGTQTTTGVGWDMAQETMDGSGLEMGTQTITGVGWDMAQETMDGSGLEMGTQTIADIGWDMAQETMDGVGLEIGTNATANVTAIQTADDLYLEMGTQTFEQFITDSHTQTDQIRNLYGNVVTQTEEDLLEFLTSETQTQTGDDLLDFLTRETQTQTCLFGYERAVQTGEDLLELFTAATQTQAMEAFTGSASMNHIGVETGDDLLELLTRETETQTHTS